MKIGYKTRLNMIGTTSEEIAESFDINNEYRIKSSEKKSTAYAGNKPVIEIIETKQNYYNIRVSDKIMKSLLERIITFHNAEKRMRK